MDSVLVVVQVGFLEAFSCFLEGLEVSRPDIFAFQRLMERFNVAILFRRVDGDEFLFDA